MQFRRFLGALAGLALTFGIVTAAQAEDVVVFAAASTTNALNDIGDLFAARGLGTIKASFAASSTLAKQVEQGAPANVFVSADLQWVDYLASHNLIVPETRSNLLGNTLVLVAPADAATKPLTIEKSTDLMALLGNGRLVTGDPDHVPVGLYAKQALTNMGQWQAIEPRLARAESVRAALALVERGEAPLGIVYSTDAAVSKGVKVIGTFPESLHDPVVYPVALVTGHDTAVARKFLDFLHTPDAKVIFEKYGFKVN